MSDYLVEWIGEYKVVAFLVSIFLNIGISIIGIIPSVFLSAFNVMVFGLIGGGIVSFLGEAIGAGVAFVLYRKGLKGFVENKEIKNKWLRSLIYVDGWKACGIIFLLRLIPFVPSSLITFYGAIGQVSFFYFLLGSSLGKIPALIIEIVSTFIAISWLENIGVNFLIVLLLVLTIYWVIRTKNERSS